MKLSTRARYGLRAMLELAGNYGNGPVMMRSITERQGISRKYLHALLTTLKTSDLVRSIRGKNGGYVLSRAPSTIRLSEVYQVLEGSLKVVDCVDGNTVCDRASDCVTRGVWDEVNLAIAGVLENITLEDLVDRKRKSEPKPTMFHI